MFNLNFLVYLLLLEYLYAILIRSQTYNQYKIDYCMVTKKTNKFEKIEQFTLELSILTS